MTPQLESDLNALLGFHFPDQIVQLAHRTRRNPDELETYVVHEWPPEDSMRQACRRLIRHLVETPDAEWPEPIRPQ